MVFPTKFGVNPNQFREKIQLVSFWNPYKPFSLENDHKNRKTAFSQNWRGISQNDPHTKKGVFCHYQSHAKVRMTKLRTLTEIFQFY